MLEQLSTWEGTIPYLIKYTTVNNTVMQIKTLNILEENKGEKLNERFLK